MHISKHTLLNYHCRAIVKPPPADQVLEATPLHKNITYIICGHSPFNAVE